MGKRIRVLLVAAVAVVLAGAYLLWRSSRPSPPADEVEKLHRMIESLPIVLAEDASRQTGPTGPRIVLARHWARLEIHKHGWGWGGTTGVDVSVSFPPGDKGGVDLYSAFADALARSPESAQRIFGHEDLRMRYMALATVNRRRAFGRRRGFALLAYPPVAEALSELVKGNGDPFVAGEVMDMLSRQGHFPVGVFERGLNHPATHVKHAALRYAHGLIEQLPPDELRAVVAAVIEHLDDSDGVARGICYQVLGPAVRQLESELGGVETPEGNAWPSRTEKLPPLPMRHVNMATMDWNEAVKVKEKWKAWLESLPRVETTPTSGQPAGEARVGIGKTVATAAAPGARR